MFNEYKQALLSINNYEDLLNVIIMYYFNKETLIWYKHLIDNKMAYKKQAQIGLFYNLPQCFVNHKLEKTRKFIALCTKDLDIYRTDLLNILNFAEQYATEKQKNILTLFMQRKSYTNIGKIIGISKQAVHDSIQAFKKKLKKKSNLYDIFIKIFPEKQIRYLTKV